MFDRISNFLSDLNSRGIPIPVARDPKTGEGSVTFTMVAISFGACVALLAGKVTNLVGDVNYDNALWLLGISLGAYLGRQFQKNGKQVSLGEEIPEVKSKKIKRNTDAGFSK